MYTRNDIRRNKNTFSVISSNKWDFRKMKENGYFRDSYFRLVTFSRKDHKSKSLKRLLLRRVLQMHRLQPSVRNWLDEQIREQFAPLRWRATRDARRANGRPQFNGLRTATREIIIGDVTSTTGTISETAEGNSPANSCDRSTDRVRYTVGRIVLSSVQQ